MLSTTYAKKMSYLQFPNYPTLPPDIIEDILATIDTQDFSTFDDLLINSSPEVIQMIKDAYGFEGKDSPLGYAGKEARAKFTTLVNYHFLDPSEKVKQWVADNLPVKAASVNIQVMTDGESVAPHIDEIRTQAINYLISTGGDVSLIFYELKDPADEKWVHPQMFIPYEKLDIKEETKVPLQLWHILPSNKIHSVENIDSTKRRISLSISII
jgi:hypothetical protein